MFLSGLDELLHRLEFGLPAQALPLTQIALPLTRGTVSRPVRLGLQHAPRSTGPAAGDAERVHRRRGGIAVAGENRY